MRGPFVNDINPIHDKNRCSAGVRDSMSRRNRDCVEMLRRRRRRDHQRRSKRRRGMRRAIRNFNRGIIVIDEAIH